MLLKTSLQLRGLPACVKKKEKYQIGCSKHKWPDFPTETSRQRLPDRDFPTETSRQRLPDRDFPLEIPTETSRKRSWQRHPDRDFPIDDFTDKLKRFENWSIIYSEKILLPTTQIWFFFVYFNWDFDKFYALSVFRLRIQRNSFMVELKF
jgi:hypothetical protein